MCGITGIYAFTDLGKDAINNLERATDAISSRGPDSKGYFRNEIVGLGHRRLSIIDVSEDGCQPMSDPLDRYVIVFNGEIFNYRELKDKLLAKGVEFRNQTDTEVLLQLYIREGKSFLDQLNGFFAFAIFDKVEHTLFIARDRMGIKPLHVYRDEDKIIFASELKGLMNFGIPRRLDLVSLYQYLQLNYIPGPSSILKGVKKLEPGSYMMIYPSGKVTKKQWYKIPYNKKAVRELKMSYEDQQKKLVQLLDESVQRRMIADVPLGAFLSGGIDSSVITALATRHTSQLNTFSIGYRDEPFFDETKYANLVAKKYNTHHTVFSLTNQDLYDHVFDVLDYLDEPFADSSALPVYILSRETRQKVTVALSGDGADEMFAGYNKHMGEFRVRHRGMAEEVIAGLDFLWDLLPKSRNASFGNRIRQFQRFAEGMASSAKSRYWRWAGYVSEKDARKMLRKKVQRNLSKDVYRKRKDTILKAITEKGDMNEVLYTDMHLVLQGDMLTKVDLMSMANSLEVRVPFLDYKVVNFAFSLPESSKINKGMKKRIVQDAFRDLLPPELYKRPKHGFEVPLLKWFRGDLRALITDDLLSDAFVEEQGLFEVDEIRALKHKLFSADPGDAHVRIWGLIVFQSWWKKWMR